MRGVITRVLELLLSVVFEVFGDVIGIILEPLLARIADKIWPGFLDSRVFWGIFFLILAIIIWWELR